MKMGSGAYKYYRFAVLFVFLAAAMMQSGCGSNSSSGSNGTDNARTLLPHQPIAVWAYPDSNTVKGTVNIGVVAYHSRGVKSVDMSIDNGPITSITEETVNPDTGEYEFVLTVDSTALTDGPHTIQATAVPEDNGTTAELAEITLFVANSVVFSTWYVDCNAVDDSGDGSLANPWKTLGRALGTEWTTQNDPHANSGDLVLLVNDTCAYDLAQDKYGDFTQYVTIKPDAGVDPVLKGGVIRSPFLKFENVRMEYQHGGIAIYAHHVWFNNCSYTGAGRIWVDTPDHDEAVRSRNTSGAGASLSHDVVIEHFSVAEANQGISMIGVGNYIVRGCDVSHQNGDGMKFQGDNVLFTGNRISYVIPPPAWTTAFSGPAYDCTASSRLTFHLDTDYGQGGYPTEFSVDLPLAVNSTSAVVSALNNNVDFLNNGFVAEISALPYPETGNVFIKHNTGNERYRFYIDGDAGGVFDFRDNTTARNPVSAATPAMHTTDHCDYIANDGVDNQNIILRNNKMYGGEGQGLKLDSIGNADRVDFYKQNIALVNNLFAANELSARLIALNFNGSGSPRSVFHYHNILMAHNTIYKPMTGLVRTGLTIDENPYMNEITIKNNVIGDYFTGDVFAPDDARGVMDFNLYTTNDPSMNTMNSNSVMGDPAFTSAGSPDWDYSLQSSSDAKGNGDPDLKIIYDINWDLRNASAPSIGAYE